MLLRLYPALLPHLQESWFCHYPTTRRWTSYRGLSRFSSTISEDTGGAFSVQQIVFERVALRDIDISGTNSHVVISPSEWQAWGLRWQREACRCAGWCVRRDGLIPGGESFGLYVDILYLHCPRALTCSTSETDFLQPFHEAVR